MATNFKSFQKELREMKQGINNAVNDVIKGVVEETFEAVREAPPFGTPVDTGWARAGWRVNVNTPTPGTVPVKGNVSLSDSEAQSSLNTFLGMNNLLMISNIYIDNRVPYIKRLNDGNNNQSGSKFVEKSIQRGSTRLNKNRNITKYE